MGGPVFGFGGGRADVFEPERDIYWGSEDKWVNQGVQTRISPEHGMHELEGPLAAIQMGLIYVNPGRAAAAIRTTMPAWRAT